MNKQTTEKVLDEDASLRERIRTFFWEQGVRIISILTTLSMAILTIALTVIDVFG